MFVVVTQWTPDDGKVITHAWGPFDTRPQASAFRHQLLKKDALDVEEGWLPFGTGNLTASISKILSAT